MKWHFSSVENDDRGVFETRGFACEIVAWRFLSHLSEHELIDYLLTEIPPVLPGSETSSILENEPLGRPTSTRMASNDHIHEDSHLLFPGRTTPVKRPKIREPQGQDHSQTGGSRMSETVDDDAALSFIGLNALELATVAGAKRFLSQRVVQDVVNGIWAGDIVFWESLSTHTKKRAQIYHPRRADPYCRLRVPRYQKAFEAVFFAIFLILYYAVLVERNPQQITVVEVLLYVWIAAFAYDEFGEFRDTGTLFYAADFWSLWDIGIIGIGAAYLVLRESTRARPELSEGLRNTSFGSMSDCIVGLVEDSDHIINVSFDILSLEALFLVPRACSLLSLHPYFGTLIPCLKEMTKDFVKFLGIVAILFFGFLTTFTMLARDSFTAREIWWTMVNVFFGSSYLGFDIASEISPALGPTSELDQGGDTHPPSASSLMLDGGAKTLALVADMRRARSDIEQVMDHAREEYLFQYVNSERRQSGHVQARLITLGQVLSIRFGKQLRNARIILLRATHIPCVAAIWVYEIASRYWSDRRDQWRNKLSSPKRPLVASHITFSHKASKYSTIRNRSEGSLMAKMSGNEGRTHQAKELDTVEEVQKVLEKLSTQEEMIEKLSRQVEKLTTQQRLSPKAEVDA
ncbi:MAG: hypothetical protein Q9201_001812 [Fulgogasparrea decipioides]